MNFLAHGLGGRSDLPLNGVAAITGGGIAVAMSFVALAQVWSRPWLNPDAGRPLSFLRFVDSPGLRWAARILTLALAAVVVAVALFGPPEAEANLAPWVLYVTFWVGLVPLSVLFGPVWRIVNPLRTLHSLLSVVSGNGCQNDHYHSRLGHWPAAGWLAGFAWLELVLPARSDPHVVGGVVLGYAAVNLVAARLFGAGWFARGDGFEVYATLIARLCPIARRSDGMLILRNPLAGLVRPDDEPGLAAVACVLIGATGFDGLTRTTFWSSSGVLGDTLGLLGSIAAVSVLYAVAMRLVSRERGLPRRFAPTLLPIALGYAVAHYFSFFLLEGQIPIILASDPFGTGLDLFGTRNHTIDYLLVSPELVAMVQINAIVLGHIASTAAAHDQALRLLPPKQARWGQLPVVLAMILLTCTALLLLLSG
ncbi:hypothetical protein MOQ72_22835 [Saccharopolyspora sp. K220]|uniref:hypothetical protein n=1 Tax=Saccharopolyspora soli TaxID=2926618 RepID=UPI001F55C20A|nr:hypothetical protein [Saccharopolyspora soli]MCI2420284.1 hypothetical protein [Saccharopolyspora soli]